MGPGRDQTPDPSLCSQIVSAVRHVNIWKGMLYRHCYIPSFQAQAVQIILFNCMQKCPP